MNSSERLDAIFAALADPTRRAILARLTAGETSVQDLLRPFRISQPALSKHLRVLETAGLVSQTKQGQLRPRKLEPQVLSMVDAWLVPYRPYWQGRLKPQLGTHR